MKNTPSKIDAALLRQRAEDLLKMKASKTDAKLSEIEMQKIVHELEVHQIELEMQNEELMRAKERAEEAAEKYGELYDFAPAGYFTLSNEGEIREINHIGAGMLGKERSQLLNARFGFFVTDETKPAFNEFLEKVFSSNVKQLCDVTLVRSNKERMTVQCIGISNKKSGECFVSAVDITERITAEEKLNESKEKYKKISLLKNSILESPQGMIFFALDKEYCYMDFSKLHKDTMKELWGVDITVGTNMLQLIANKDDREKAKHNFDSALQGKSFVNEEEYGSEQLKRTFYENRYNPIYDEHNIIRGLSVFVIDITERKRAEVILMDKRVRLQGIIEGTNVGTWEWNIQTGETVYNERWAEIIGYRLNELSSSNISTWQKLVHPDDLKKSAELLGRHLAGELPYYICECRIKHKQGHWVWVQDRGRIVTRSAKGEPLKMFGTHTDISDRKKNEIERERLIKGLQSALVEVKTLKGIVPICSGCKKIRDDEGFWNQVEIYVQKHTNAKFSHGFCPDCVGKYFPGHAERILKKKTE